MQDKTVKNVAKFGSDRREIFWTKSQRTKCEKPVFLRMTKISIFSAININFLQYTACGEVCVFVWIISDRWTYVDTFWMVIVSRIFGGGLGNILTGHRGKVQGTLDFHMVSQKVWVQNLVG